MPAWNIHVRQAEHNERTYAYLGAASPDHLDWQVTCLFYAALHYADAYLHRLHQANILHDGGHRERNRFVLVHMGLPHAGYLRRLQDRSEGARYKAERFTVADVQTQYSDRFLPFRTHVRTALGV